MSYKTIYRIKPKRIKNVFGLSPINLKNDIQIGSQSKTQFYT